MNKSLKGRIDKLAGADAPGETISILWEVIPPFNYWDIIGATVKRDYRNNDGITADPKTTNRKGDFKDYATLVALSEEAKGADTVGTWRILDWIMKDGTKERIDTAPTDGEYTMVGLSNTHLCSVKSYRDEYKKASKGFADAMMKALK